MTQSQLIMLALGIAASVSGVTLLLFVTGVVISGPVHRAMLEQLRQVLADVLHERDYYRSAAQSCASTVAEVQAQNNVMMAAMQRWQGGGDAR